MLGQRFNGQSCDEKIHCRVTNGNERHGGIARTVTAIDIEDHSKDVAIFEVFENRKPRRRSSNQAPNALTNMPMATAAMSVEKICCSREAANRGASARPRSMPTTAPATKTQP